MSQTWRLKTPRLISAQSKRSCEADASPSRNRAWAFSEGVRKPADSIELGRKMAEHAPTKTVIKPSTIRIHLQPSSPPAGPIALRPRARSPPKAPEREAAV